jgi:DNA-binding FadR family transcriptional regulator
VTLTQIDSDFLRYLLSERSQPGGRIPSLDDISAEIGISVGKLREQLEVARVLGLVEVGPRRGIRRKDFDFVPAVRLSLMIALSLDPSFFSAYSALRIHLETAFWEEAVRLLTDEDKMYLRELVEKALAKLSEDRVQIPHAEHRELHLAIFRRLDNPFVRGLLEVYWDGYEAVALNTYADYAYLTEVWAYHQRFVEAICAGDYEAGKQLLIEHMHLIDKLGVSHEGLTTNAPAPNAQSGALVTVPYSS